MKLLENALLDGISAALCMDTGDCKIAGRYICVLCLVFVHVYTSLWNALCMQCARVSYGHVQLYVPRGSPGR